MSTRYAFNKTSSRHTHTHSTHTLHTHTHAHMSVCFGLQTTGEPLAGVWLDKNYITVYPHDAVTLKLSAPIQPSNATAVVVQDYAGHC